MNYFEFYGIEPTLMPDLGEIRVKFLGIQKEWHPDYFASDAEKESQAMVHISNNNKAFQVLNNTEQRIAHLLQLQNVISDSDKNVLGNELLMEMMDLQDEISDLQGKGDEEKQPVYQKLQSFQSAFETGIAELHTAHPLVLNMPESGWRRLLELYQLHKYVSRLRKNLDGVHEM